MEDLERALRTNNLAIPAISVGTGILLPRCLLLESIWGIALIFLAVAIYIFLIYWVNDPVKSYRYRMWHYIWLALGFIGVGIILYSYLKVDRLDCVDGKTAYSIKGTIDDIYESTGGDVITLGVERIIWENGDAAYFENLPLRVTLVNTDFVAHIGDIIEFPGVIEKIKVNNNSFTSGYQSLMASKGIYHSCHVSGGKIKLTGHSVSFGGVSRKIRNNIECFIENSGLSKPVQNFLIAILLGDRAYLDSSLQQSFADAGVAHLLALSGMHMCIIGGILLFLLFPLNFAGRYKLRVIFAAALLWIYCFVTGMAPSTVRACVMISFATIALVLERKRYVFNSLFAASLIILLVSPDSLFDIGFQLSFICVASLAAFAGHLNKVDHRRNPRLYRILSVLCGTIVATFGSWIVSAYYFKSFPISFLPANMIMLPVLPYYIIISISYFILHALGLEMGWLEKFIESGYGAMTEFIKWIGYGNSIEIDVSREMVLLWLAALVLLGCFLNIKKWKPLIYCSLIIFVAIICLIPVSAKRIGEGSFIFSDSYHNISLVVKCRDNEEIKKFKRGVVSRICISNVSIISVDCPIYGNEDACKCDYLIIAGGYKGSIKDLEKYYPASKIVIHPSVRRKRELSLLEEANYLGLECHSLRLHKPLYHYN